MLQGSGCNVAKCEKCLIWVNISASCWSCVCKWYFYPHSLARIGPTLPGHLAAPGCWCRWSCSGVVCPSGSLNGAAAVASSRWEALQAAVRIWSSRSPPRPPGCHSCGAARSPGWPSSAAVPSWCWMGGRQWRSWDSWISARSGSDRNPGVGCKRQKVVGVCWIPTLWTQPLSRPCGCSSAASCCVRTSWRSSSQGGRVPTRTAEETRRTPPAWRR